MKILEVSERSSVDIPIHEIMDSGGKLRIRSDLIGKGLVELRQHRHTLNLRINGIVGRLPVTDSLALDIKPKFPVSNLNRMIYESQAELKNPFFLNRPYERIKSTEYLPVPLIQSYSTSLKKLIAQGLLREYIREEVNGSPKPKINFIKSQQRFWSKLDPTKAVMERFDFSQNNMPNQCLKIAAVKALALSKNIRYLEACVPILAECLRQLERVELKSHSYLIAMLPSVHSRIPSFRTDYAHSLALALELINHTDISLDVAKSGLHLESFIISLDDAFERYIRSIVLKIPLEQGFLNTVDGNLKKHQGHLFLNNKKYKMKPDLLIKNQGKVIFIGDVKYKIKPQEEDRYQVISHALGFGVDKAILIYPKSYQNEGGLKHLGLCGKDRKPISIFEYYFDLSADLQTEENSLRHALISLHSP